MRGGGRIPSVAVSQSGGSAVVWSGTRSRLQARVGGGMYSRKQVHTVVNNASVSAAVLLGG